MGNDIDLCHQFNTFSRSLSTLQQAVEPATSAPETIAVSKICQQANDLQQQFQSILSVLSAAASSESASSESASSESASSESASSESASSESASSESADLEAIAPAVAQRIQPYQTEAHRRLRLIVIESMRLRTARSPASIDRGCSQLLRHLNQLQQFTQAMIAEVCAAEDTGVS